MRILLTADPEIPVPPILYGGIQRIVHLLAKEYSTRGHEVGLVAAEGSLSNTDFFTSWPHPVSSGFVGSLKNIRCLQKAVSTFQPDVIHSFSRLLYVLPAIIRGIPTVMSYQRTPGRKQVAYAQKLARPSRLLFTACSEHIADRGKTPCSLWRSIPNCLDQNQYHMNSIVEETAPLVFLGRLDPIKGAHTAIHLAQQSGRKLIIAGNISETIEGQAYYTKHIEPHLATPNIEYIGPVNDQEKQDLLAKACALIAPIEWDEPFGIVYIEALACGTPVLTARRGAASEIITHGVHGYLCSTIAEYIQAIQSVQKIDRIACREQFERHYTTERVSSLYLSAYRELQP